MNSDPSIPQPPPAPHARGSASNPANRFEQIHLEPDADWNPEEDAAPRTLLLKDLTSKILTENESPDIPVEISLNPYRGCEHGCAYCYARPTHEYLGFSAGLDFETRIMVKENAPELLEQELSSAKWKPRVISMSGVTDCYQPVERRLRITRRCLEVLARFRNPVAMITKNQLVTRDLDLLGELARHEAAQVCLSITSLDPELRKTLEPRTSPPAARLAAVRALAQAGVPVGIMIGPVIPGLNDHEIPAILAASAEAGARFCGYEMLRLPWAVAPLFEAWLERHYPLKKEKVLNQIRSVRGGKLNDPRFGFRMRGEGPLADRISQLFDVAARRAGFLEDWPELSTKAFSRSGETQLGLGI